MGVGIGVACRDRTVAFVSTFAAFFTRAFDQLRMGAISQVSLAVVTLTDLFVFGNLGFKKGEHKLMTLMCSRVV